ncbi:histidine kinase dimerization/phosphoacceptor domain -containing protein [Alkalispirochaeta alkalica]|uniref:histidine kinase dimerization/phosphoacceptor domain -containing protein n=1 Tax=Alkalispirochaeta alkalica TaxID=46356 RepID=UPI001461557D|nr:histidine kinase dimerization/phosphoacceptor domain -containing protein [Alkalispirochaeta alkalica]
MGHHDSGQYSTLRSDLAVSFITITAVAVVLVGGISFHNARWSINSVSTHLRREVVLRIQENLESFLEPALQINQANTRAVSAGQIDPEDQGALLERFRQQIDLIPSVSSVYFGNTRGGLANSGRESLADERYVIFTEGFRAGPFEKWSIDPRGTLQELVAVVPDFDARTRGWYRDALALDEAVWSDVYVLFTGQDMALAASRPAYDPGGTFVGVFSVDLFLGKIGDFLQSLEIGARGKAFLVDNRGYLVASSLAEETSILRNGEGGYRLRRLDESSSDIIRAAATLFRNEERRFSPSPGLRDERFFVGGRAHFIHVAPLRYRSGPDWFIGVVIPEADFMGRIEQNNRILLLIILAVLFFCAALGVLTARRITGPIKSLTDAAGELASGERAEQIPEDSPLLEIHQLTHSFNEMSRRLAETVAGLKEEVREREQAQVALQHSLDEKEVLLREVHHRVNNNLSVVAGLLNLQASTIRTPQQAVAGFEMSRSRIMTMALVHEELCTSEDLARIGMDPFLNHVAMQVPQFQETRGRITLNIDAGDLSCSVDQAIVCGLVVNELVGNAITYAFPRGEPGQVWVTLRERFPGYELVVRDNGVGLPEGVASGDTLGLTLVRMLAEQIRGDFRIEPSPGAHFRLLF